MAPKRPINSDTLDVGEGEISMSIEENVQLVKDFFAAMGSYNEHDLLALAAEDAVRTVSVSDK